MLIDWQSVIEAIRARQLAGAGNSGKGERMARDENAIEWNAHLAQGAATILGRMSGALVDREAVPVLLIGMPTHGQGREVIFVAASPAMDLANLALLLRSVADEIDHRREPTENN